MKIYVLCTTMYYDDNVSDTEIFGASTDFLNIQKEVEKCVKHGGFEYTDFWAEVWENNEYIGNIGFDKNGKIIIDKIK